MDRRIKTSFQDLLSEMPMSQAALADKLGIARSTVSSWSRGKTQPSSQDVKRAIDAIESRLNEIQNKVTRIRDLLKAKQDASKKKAKSRKPRGNG